MATFDGFDLGPVTSCMVVPNPHRWQVNTYAGTDGRERLDLGTDGGTVLVQGVSYGANLAALTTWWNTIYGYQKNATLGDLIDNEAATTPDCVLDKIEPDGPIMTVASGGFARKYKLTFLYDG